MKDIAVKAGVSQSTVSFVLSGHVLGLRITPETRQRVLIAAQEMGYRRNELARAMVTGKSGVLGLLTHDASSEHISAIVAGALDEAVGRGYSTKVVHIPYSGTREEKSEIVHRCSSWRLDGTIAISLTPDVLEVLWDEMQNTNCPIAYVENLPEGKPVTGAISDIYSGIRAAVQHLVELGHTEIAFLSGPQDSILTQPRDDVFRRVMGEFDLPLKEGSLLSSHWCDLQIINDSIAKLLDSPKRATAVICPGDGAAMILIRQARLRGITVPDDLSVIGFGNFQMGRFSDPPLTSIGQHFRTMGETAMKRLIAAIEEHHSRESQLTGEQSCVTEVPVVDLQTASLVVRESTAPPSSSRWAEGFNEGG